jgi:serine/threonine-protein kinase
LDVLERLQTALAERYRIERELGRGGMATVYLAQDLKHGRRVALKVLRPELSPALGADRFHREIAIASRLQHPHIVSLHDSGEAGGMLYYAMPYVEGESLRERLEREVQLDMDDAVRIAGEVAEALTCAHAAGVLHRDIKPENIMLSAGHAMVADFGIARALDVAGGDRLTETGLALGTPHYMSPEQGAGGGPIDARSDIYALGCVLYEMLAGEPPFTGPTAQAILARHSVDPIPSLRTVRRTLSPAVEAVVIRAMEKVPADRYGSAREFREALARAGREPAPTAGRSFRRRTVLQGLAAAALIAAAGAGVWSRMSSDSTGTVDPEGAVRSLAVLPFANLTGDSAQLYLAEGITDQLVAALAQIGPLRVIRLQGDQARIPTPQLASVHGIDAVVGGSLQRSGDALRITAQLSAAATGRAMWARSFDGEMGHILTLQDQVARSLADRIQVSPPPSRPTLGGTRQEVNPAAYEAYVRGSYFWGKGTEEGHRKSIGHFQRAIDIEPTYAAAYAGLAQTYFDTGYLTIEAPQEAFPKARAAAARALELDSTLAEAHSSMARSHYMFEWNFAAADREFRQAVRLNPKSAFVRISYGTYLAAMGRRAESVAEGKQLRELDPLSLMMQAAAARPLYNARRYEETAAQARTALELDSTFNRAHYWLGMAYEQLGRQRDAILEFEETIARAGRLPVYLSALGHAYAKAGRRDEAHAIVKELRGRTGSDYISPVDIATIYVGLDDKDAAFEWLEKGYEGRAYGLVFINADPRFDALRADPRFAGLIRRVGQEPAAVVSGTGTDAPGPGR